MASSDQPEMTLSDPQLMEEIVRHFNQAMQQRSEMNARIARRVTLIIRIGMVTLALSAVALLLLIYVLSDKAESVVQSLDTMNSHIGEITRNMELMESNVQLFSGYTSGIPTIVNDIESMDRIMQNLGTDIHKVDSNIKIMHRDIYGLSREMSGMDHSFKVMSDSVSGVSRDVNQISQPMQTFNDFFPFP